MLCRSWHPVLESLWLKAPIKPSSAACCGRALHTRLPSPPMPWLFQSIKWSHVLTDNFEIFTSSVLQEKDLNITFSLQLLENSSRCPKCRYPLCQESALGDFAKVKVIILMSKQACYVFIVSLMQVSSVWENTKLSVNCSRAPIFSAQIRFSLPYNFHPMNNNLVQHINTRWMTQPTPQSQPWDFSI